MENKKYQYSNSYRFARGGGLVMMALSILFILFTIIMLIVQPQKVNIDNPVELVWDLVFLILMFYSSISFSYIWTDFCVSEKGIAIKFLFFNINILWEDIVEVKKVKVTPIHSSWLVITKKLTLFHYLYSIIYAFKFKPGFLIHSSLDGYAEVLQIIKKNRRKAKGRYL